MEKLPPKKLPSKIRNARYFQAPEYCGTEQYHKINSFGLVGTDGALYAFKTLEAFWVGDIIASYISQMRKTGDTFFVARVFIKEDGGADFYIDDGNYNVLIYQEIPYTDLKENLQLYVTNEGKYYLTLLPSEY